MGFYVFVQIVCDVCEYGVMVRFVDINESFWDNVMEFDGQGGLVLWLGFCQIKGICEEDVVWIIVVCGNGYLSVEEVWWWVGIGLLVIMWLVEVDVFVGFGFVCCEVLWEVKVIWLDKFLLLFEVDMDGEVIFEVFVNLFVMILGEQVVEDYVFMCLSFKVYLVVLLCDQLMLVDVVLVE